MEGVKYEEEIFALKERLSSVKKKIRVKINVLTKNSLIELCSAKPKVLHLMCHGSYNKRGMFLVTEDNLAKLHPMYPKKIKKVI